MLRSHQVIRDAASVVARASLGAVDDLRERLVEQEPHFTDRMLGRIAHAMNDYRSKVVAWKAKTLTDRAPGPQEKSSYGLTWLVDGTY